MQNSNYVKAFSYLKSMYGLRVAGFLEYNVTRELSHVEIEIRIFTRKFCVHFCRVCFVKFF